MHTRQGVAIPALSEHSSPASAHPNDYEQDALRRELLHQHLWSAEPLTDWQRYMLQGEVRA